MAEFTCQFRDYSDFFVTLHNKKMTFASYAHHSDSFVRQWASRGDFVNTSPCRATHGSSVVSPLSPPTRAHGRTMLAALTLFAGVLSLAGCGSVSLDIKPDA